MGTQFSAVYNHLLNNKITEDMYLELTPQDTLKDLQNMIIGILPGFEFPRKNLMNYTINTAVISKADLLESDFIIEELDTEIVKVDRSAFNEDLTLEEIDILAILMMEAWVQRQLTSIENTRMKYTGSDFKMTSQANHMAKLQSLELEAHRQSIHMQRLYKRRRLRDDGKYESNWSIFRTTKNS